MERDCAIQNVMQKAGVQVHTFKAVVLGTASVIDMMRPATNFVFGASATGSGNNNDFYVLSVFITFSLILNGCQDLE